MLCERRFERSDDSDDLCGRFIPFLSSSPLHGVHSDSIAFTAKGRR